MTHVLITITELEEREADLRVLREKASGGNMKAFYASAISEVILIKSFGKEVSLTEKDIILKAEEVYPPKLEVDFNDGITFDGNRDYRLGYKQALKDLR